MSEHTEETPKGNVSGFSPEGYTPPQEDEDEGHDPYENVVAWVRYRREIAQYQYEEDRDDAWHAHQGNERMPEPSDYWYGPGFASVFAEKIGGHLDSFTTMPTIPAVIDYLEEEYSKKLERPDCDYLSTILQELFPQPNARVMAALQWLEQRKAELSCWPPEQLFGLFIGSRKAGHYNRDSEHLTSSTATESIIPTPSEEGIVEYESEEDARKQLGLLIGTFPLDNLLREVIFLSSAYYNDPKGLVARTGSWKSGFTAVYRVLQRLPYGNPCLNKYVTPLEWAKLIRRAYNVDYSESTAKKGESDPPVEKWIPKVENWIKNNIIPA